MAQNPFTTVYPHWSQFPMEHWRWPSFSPQEMASKGEGELMINAGAMDKLQALRNAVGRPVMITSAYRSHAHNRRVGGATKSQHREAKAFDVMMTNHDPASFERQARACGFTGFGYYPKQGFMHIDTGPARSWGDPFPKSATAPTPQFRPEPKTDTIKEIITKPEVLMAGGSALSGGAAMTQGNGPVQFALAVVLVVIVCALVAFLAMKILTRPRDV